MSVYFDCVKEGNGVCQIVSNLWPRRWLVSKGKDERAKKILTRVHPTNEKKVEDELQVMQAGAKAAESQRFRDKLKEFFHWSILKR